MQFHPYLMFDGQCEEAFKFYERVLGGEIAAMMRFEGSPAEDSVPPEWRGKIMHARLVVDGMTLMGSDAPQGFERPQGFSISINIDKPAEAERIFNALGEDGEIRMKMEETFWARRFGMVVDRFGTPWMVNCEKAH